jgi:hypothetical protein
LGRRWASPRTMLLVPLAWYVHTELAVQAVRPRRRAGAVDPVVAGLLQSTQSDPARR